MQIGAGSFFPFLAMPVHALGEIRASLVGESTDAKSARQSEQRVVGCRQVPSVYIDHRSDFRSRNIGDRTALETPKRRSAGMRSGGPGERCRKLGMALYYCEMSSHAFLNALARPLPAMFLGDASGKSMDGDGALGLNDAND